MGRASPYPLPWGGEREQPPSLSHSSDPGRGELAVASITPHIQQIGFTELQLSPGNLGLIFPTHPSQLLSQLLSRTEKCLLFFSFWK